MPNWATAARDNLKDYGRIMEVPQQKDFYRNRVKNADTRVFVLISDAMRYEVAVTLANELRQETQANVRFESCEGIFPTVTKFEWPPFCRIMISPQNCGRMVSSESWLTESLRKPVTAMDLKKANPSSVALYKNIIKMKRADRSALVKGMDVVYSIITGLMRQVIPMKQRYSIHARMRLLN